VFAKHAEMRGKNNAHRGDECSECNAEEDDSDPAHPHVVTPVMLSISAYSPVTLSSANAQPT
jgi:hypothetical protein